MVDEAVCPEYVERELVRMRPAFSIPFFADCCCVAIGVESESLSGRGKHVAKDFAADL